MGFMRLLRRALLIHARLTRHYVVFSHLSTSVCCVDDLYCLTTGMYVKCVWLVAARNDGIVLLW